MSVIEKSKELIVEELLANARNEITQHEVSEKFLNQKVILAKSGRERYEYDLAKVQSELKDISDWAGFLETYSKELNAK